MQGVERTSIIALLPARIFGGQFETLKELLRVYRAEGRCGKANKTIIRRRDAKLRLRAAVGTSVYRPQFKISGLRHQSDVA